MSDKNDDLRELVNEDWETFQRYAEKPTWPIDVRIGSAFRLIQAKELIAIGSALDAALTENPDSEQLLRAKHIIQAVALWQGRWLPEECGNMIEDEPDLV